MMISFPPAAAWCSNVSPLLFFKVGSDFLSIRALNASNLPRRAAIINGVAPLLLLESMSSPRDSSFSMMTLLLPPTA